LGRVNYYQYLASRAWGVLRRQVRERAKGLCERCKTRPMKETHHLNYRHLGNEPLEDLLGVCRGCHSYLGGYSDQDPMLLCLLCEGRVEAGERYCSSCASAAGGATARFDPAAVKAIVESGVPEQYIPEWSSFSSSKS
jgi:hypothetical protein